MFKIIKDYIEAIKTGIDYRIGGALLYNKRTTMGKEVWVSDGFLHGIMGIKPTIPGICVTKIAANNGTENAIVANRKFLSMPSWWQECALLHEEGHIVLGHLDKQQSKFRQVCYLIQRIFTEPSIEHEADIYAYNEMGSIYIDFLHEYNKFDVQHINKRISFIERSELCYQSY